MLLELLNDTEDHVLCDSLPLKVTDRHSRQAFGTAVETLCRRCLQVLGCKSWLSFQFESPDNTHPDNGMCTWISAACMEDLD